MDAWNASDNGTANARSSAKYTSWYTLWMFCICWYFAAADPMLTYFSAIAGRIR